MELHRHCPPGNKIEAIENLGATEDQFDTIDLSDNGILRLDGFPLLPRLKTLLLSGNAIRRFGKGLEGGDGRLLTHRRRERRRAPLRPWHASERLGRRSRRRKERPEPLGATGRAC